MRRDGEAERPDAAAQNSAGCLDQVARLIGKQLIQSSRFRVPSPAKVQGFTYFPQPMATGGAQTVGNAAPTYSKHALYGLQPVGRTIAC